MFHIKSVKILLCISLILNIATILLAVLWCLSIISWNRDMLNWSLVCSLIYSENIFAWNILHIIFWWYDKAYHCGAGSNCFFTNLLSQLCELWPHFYISLTLLACCCTPCLLVILGHSQLNFTNCTQQIFKSFISVNHTEAYRSYHFWYIWAKELVVWLLFKLRYGNEHLQHTFTPWPPVAHWHVSACFNLLRK